MLISLNDFIQVIEMAKKITLLLHKFKLYPFIR